MHPQANMCRGAVPAIQNSSFLQTQLNKCYPILPSDRVKSNFWSNVFLSEYQTTDEVQKANEYEY